MWISFFYFRMSRDYLGVFQMSIYSNLADTYFLSNNDFLNNIANIYPVFIM